MPAPTAAELLGAWEWSAPLGPVEREDTLLRLAEPGVEPAELAVGERDARLLELRELLFGTELDGIAECPRCGEPVEYALETGDLLAGRPERAALDLVVSGHNLRARLPTGADLAEAASARDLDAARALLLERCLLEDFVVPEADIAGVLAEQLAEADRLADARLSLACPECRHEWTVAFEAGAWLWSELEAWAWRTLLDVHALASAYGWSEAEILALGPRRELYLELVGG
jgi:hypothetical protein